MGDDQKLCFVISEIGEAGSAARKRADQVLKHVVRRAAEECGYRVLRADEISEPGIITGQVIQLLMDAPLVIADLTGRNPNVFYELAIRHITRKPLVQMIDEKEGIPFDVAPLRTIKFSHTDLDSAESARGELIKHIRAVEKDPAQVDNPITTAIDLSALKGSEKPADQQLAAILEALTEIRAELRTTQDSLAFVSSSVGLPTSLSDVLGASSGTIGSFSREHVVPARYLRALRKLRDLSAKQNEEEGQK
jgi:hypothetical protein